MTAGPGLRGLPRLAVPSRTATGAIASRAAGMAGAFAMGVAILRALPKGDAGLVLLIYTLTTLAAAVARFGTDGLALREVSRAPLHCTPLVRHCAQLTFITAIPATALMAVAVVIQGRGTTPWLVVAGAMASVLPAALSIVAGAVLRGLGKVASGTFAELGSPLIIAAIGISALGLTHHATLTTVVWAMTAGTGMTALWSWALVVRHEPDITTRIDGFGTFMRRYRGSLLSFCMTTIGFFLFSWMPVLALGYFAASHTVGQYNVALYNAGARLAQFVALVPTIQISYLSQQFARLHHDGELTVINRLAQSATRQAVAVAAPVTALIFLFPSQVLSVFGHYRDATTTMQVLAVGALLVALAGPVNGLMLTCGHERLAGRFTLALLAASAIALPLLARHGAVGVAVGGAAISLLYAAACYVTLAREGIHAALPHRKRR